MLNVLVLGLLNGAIYALVSAGLSLTYGRQNVIDLANPAFVVVGAYLVASAAGRFGVDPFVVAPLAAIVLFAVGVLIQKFVINPLLSRPDYEMHVQSCLVLFGLALFVQTLLVIVFSADYRAFNTSYTNSVTVIGDLRLPNVKLMAAALAFGTLICLYVFLKHSYFGKAILATYADRQTAQLLSINVKLVDIVTFGLGTAIAGIAGLVIALTFSFSPSSVSGWTIIAFAVVVIGGKGSVLGTLAAGLALGLVEALVSATIGANWIYMVAYSLLLLVFLVRPTGFFGEKA